MSFYSRVLLVAMSLLSPFSYAANPSKETTAETYLQLRLTHTLYQGVLASYFNENDEHFDAQYFADKAYLETFLNTWSKMIDSGTYHSTQEVFTEISQHGRYLAKYFKKWQNLQDYHQLPGKVNLGGSKEQFLAQVLVSESRQPDLNQRLAYILQMANVLLITNDSEYELGQAIASPFANNAYAATRAAAAGILASIPLQKKVKLASLAFDILGLVRGSPSVVGATQLIRVPNVFRGLRAGATLFAHTAKVVSRRAVNPILGSMTRARWSGLISASLHSAGAGALFLTDHPFSHAASGKELPHYQDNVIEVGALWDTLNTTYPYSFILSENDDFIPNFKMSTLPDMIAHIRDHLQNATTLEYGETFLLAEKLVQVDERPTDDLLAMDFVQNRYGVLKVKAAQIFQDQQITQDKLNTFRALLIDDVLYNYKRDYPNLTATLLNWGGNCVAETMLMIALLEPYQKQLPPNQQLVVAEWTDHVEAGIWDGKQLTGLTYGKQTTGTDGTLFKPQRMLERILRNFPGALDNLPHPNSHISKGDPIADAASKKGSGGNQGASLNCAGGIWNLAKRFYSGQKCDKRNGVMDTNTADDLDPATGGADGDSAGDDSIPYSAEINFSEISKGMVSSLLDHLSKRSYSDDEKREARRKPPEFTISINLEPNDSYFVTDFIYDQNSKTLTAFNLATYELFMKKRREAKITDANFELLIWQKMREQILKAQALPLLNKIYAQPQTLAESKMALDALLKITDDDIENLKKLADELKNLENRYMRYDVNKLDDNAGIDFNFLSQTILNFYGTNAQTNIEAYVNASRQADYLALGEVQLMKTAVKNPRLFFEAYDKADAKLRNHLLMRFFGISFWSYAGSSTSQVARFRLRDYLANLAEIKVDFSQENNWICSKVKIDLPKVKYWPLEWTEFPNQGCGATKISPETKAKNISAEKSDAQSADTLKLKLSTLIEVTIGFSRGLQLWNDDVISAFVDGRYNKIGPDRDTSIKIIKNTLESDPDLSAMPRYQPLKALMPVDSGGTPPSSTRVYH